MAANSRIWERKREHPETFEEGSPADSSESRPASSEGATVPDHELSLNALLDKLHQPPTVSQWCEDYNDEIIRKYFKIRRTVVDPDDFIARYLCCGDVLVYEDMKIDWAAEMGPLQDFLQQYTSYINITESQLFLPSKFPEAERQSLHRQRIHDRLMLRLEDIENLTSLLDGVKFTKYYRRLASELKTNIRRWVKKVAKTVKSPPRDVQESTYEDVFRMYLEAFNLECIHGSSVKLGIPYRNGTVSSAPDILFKRDERLSRFCGVVEVKKMTLDPSFKHAFVKAPEKGILSDSNDGPKPPKKRNVDFQAEAAPGPSGEEESEEKETDKPPSASDKRGAPPTESERQFIKIFFGQLFGSVLALDCCDPPAMGQPRQRLGIGVVGFRVVFLLFTSKPAVPFKDVPCVGSNRMDVVMTSELSLLKASDRREINKILLAVSVNEPLPEVKTD